MLQRSFDSHPDRANGGDISTLNLLTEDGVRQDGSPRGRMNKVSREVESKEREDYPSPRRDSWPEGSRNVLRPINQGSPCSHSQVADFRRPFPHGYSHGGVSHDWEAADYPR